MLSKSGQVRASPGEDGGALVSHLRLEFPCVLQQMARDARHRLKGSDDGEWPLNQQPVADEAVWTDGAHHGALFLGLVLPGHVLAAAMVGDGRDPPSRLHMPQPHERGFPQRLAYQMAVVEFEEVGACLAERLDAQHQMGIALKRRALDGRARLATCTAKGSGHAREKSTRHQQERARGVCVSLQSASLPVCVASVCVASVASTDAPPMTFLATDERRPAEP